MKIYGTTIGVGLVRPKCWTKRLHSYRLLLELDVTYKIVIYNRCLFAANFQFSIMELQAVSFLFYFKQSDSLSCVYFM